MTATFRPTRGGWAYLKLKGEVGRSLFDGLTGAHVKVYGALAEHQRRRGVHLLGSTQNVADEVVVEVRFAHTGDVAPAEVNGRLYHSLEPNRSHGEARYADSSIQITGQAGQALARWIDPASTRSDVTLRVADPRNGVVVLDSPRPPWAS